MPDADNPINLTLTTDAVDLFLAWRRTRDEGLLTKLLEHPGYQTVRDHCAQWGGVALTPDHLADALEGRPSPVYGLRDLTGREEAIVRLAGWIEDHRDEITSRVAAMLAPVFTSAELDDIGLHCIVGYDIGIGLGGRVAVNLNAAKYLDNPQEIVYFLAHEAAHVAYERIHGRFGLGDLTAPGALKRVVCLLIHTEGVSVYVPLAARLREGQVADRDYQALLDPAALAGKIQALRDLCAGLTDEYPGDAVTGALFERLSAERLSYVAGCEILRRIEMRDGLAGVRAAVHMDPVDFVTEGLALLTADSAIV